MEGPPISICSIASSKLTPARATVSSKGYKFTTTKSIIAIPCCSAASRWLGLSRRQSNPPCTLGCRVFTRPSIISGNPVWSLTSVTGISSSRSNLAVPPVESRVKPWLCTRARAKGTNPDLSLTESNAYFDIPTLSAFSPFPSKRIP